METTLKSSPSLSIFEILANPFWFFGKNGYGINKGKWKQQQGGPPIAGAFSNITHLNTVVGTQYFRKQWDIIGHEHILFGRTQTNISLTDIKPIPTIATQKV